MHEGQGFNDTEINAQHKLYIKLRLHDEGNNLWVWHKIVL